MLLPVQVSPTCELSNTDPAAALLVEPLESLVARYPSLEVGTSVVHRDNLLVHVLNRSDSPVKLHANTHLASIVDIDIPNAALCAAAATNDSEQDPVPSSSLPTSSSPSSTPITAIESYISKNCSHLSPDDQQRLHDLLLAYHDVFTLSADDRGYCNIAPHQIHTGDQLPIKQRPYRLPVPSSRSAAESFDRPSQERHHHTII